MNNHTDNLETISSTPFYANFTHKGELLLPDNEIYPSLIDEKSIEKTAKKIFYWTGHKPSNLKYKLDPGESEYRDRKIIINASLSEYEVAAIISRQCIEHIFSVNKIDATPEMIDLALIELGLGIIVINSFGSKNSFQNKIGGLAGIKQIQPDALSSLSTKEFSRRFEEYIEENELDNKVIIEHLLPWAISYLDIKAKGPGKINYEDYVKSSRHEQLVSQIKIGGVLFCLTLTFALLMLLYLQRTPEVPKELELAKVKINELRESFIECTDELKEKQKQYNTDDIYMVRQLDAKVNECESIKNKYDFQVQELDKLIAN
jgi:hypothetical protein